MLSETKGILKKAGFTLMAITIYLLGSQIAVPAVKLTRHYQQLMHESSVSALAAMSGLICRNCRFSVLALRRLWWR